MHMGSRVTALLTGIGSLLLANSARATLYNLDVSGVPGIETGSYHVVIDETNNNTDFQILSIHANNGINTPSADVFRVRLYFYSGKNDTGINLGGLGFTAGNTAGTNSLGTNWGAGAVGGGGSNPQFKNYAQYGNPAANHGVGPNNLLANGSNTFTQNGAFTLSNASAQSLGSVLIQLNDGETFEGGFNVPEASTLALLLPGLIPLGFALRRRIARG
jgi:hypothetical protein